MVLGGHDYCGSATAASKRRGRRWTRACIFFEEIKVSNALALVLWSTATGPRATRAGSSRTGPGSRRPLCRAPDVVDGAPASGRRPATTCGGHRGKAVQRSLKGATRTSASVRAPRATAHQRRPRDHAPDVFPACTPPEINIFMSLEAAMLRYCSIMAPVTEGAGTRARDSARPAARRPGPRNLAGAVSVLGRPQQRLRAGERVRFCTNWLTLA